MVRETIGLESVVPQKLRDEEHSNLFIQPNTDRTSTMFQALLWMLELYLQKKGGKDSPFSHGIIF